MASRKRKRTEEEVRESRAHSAWLYRERHKELINEKARVRMQKYREGLKSAPSAVQRESQIRAKRYRRNYKERTKDPLKTLTTPSSEPITTKSKVPKSPAKASSGLAPPPAARASALFVEKGSLGTAGTVQARAPALPIPRGLAEIDWSSSSDDSSDQEDDDDAWDADTEKETSRTWTTLPDDGLGPLLNPTGHPDYVPQPGQQPYFKQGRKYWFLPMNNNFIILGRFISKVYRRVTGMLWR
ncbi:hypothetical protein B0H15DRAFT_958486 [Mycena belliarum]|uniref:Uncharacterized protein n=1 Tax=Mycena belliarum TaxID=1033014 RepID=A0AAD6XHI1_9AGAR|nr:hypothetical protein B0H15DRAFT_958486 [Mycena belliae]